MPPTKHDQSLLALSTDGNKVAETLYTEHGKSLKNYVLRIVPKSSSHEAEDVIQETFAHTVAHLNNGKEVRSPKWFLFTTARNLVTSMFYRGRQRAATGIDFDEFVTNANIACPERRAMVMQELDALCAGVAGLPKPYQEAFVRVRVWGESCRHIAATMGVSEATVWSYASRGGRLMKRYCQEHDIVLGAFSDEE